MALPTEEHVPAASAPPTPVAGAVQSYAIVLQGREGRLDGVLTILDGLSVAMEVAAEMRERGTAVTVMRWTPPS